MPGTARISSSLMAAIFSTVSYPACRRCSNGFRVLRFHGLGRNGLRSLFAGLFGNGRLDLMLPFLLALLVVLGFAQDVDLPARELCREPHVLALLADRERKLGIRDHGKG